MAYQDMPTQTMITVTLEWVDAEKQRPLIERCPRLAPLLPDIEKAHTGLVFFQNKGKQESAEVTQLRAKTTALDAQHDRFARGVHHLLIGLAEVSEAFGIDDAYSKPRAELFPQGLDINSQAYLVEAGDVPMRERRLSDESKRALEATVIRTPEGEASLRDIVNRWNEIALALGEAESEKVRLKAGDVSEGSSGPARRAWVKIVTLFVQTLALETGLSDAERRKILEPLQNAEAKARKKRALAKKGIPFDPDAEEEGAATAG